MLFEHTESGTKEVKREADVCAVQQYERCCNNCGGEYGMEHNKCLALNKCCNSCNNWNHFAKPQNTGGQMAPSSGTSVRNLHRINKVRFFRDAWNSNYLGSLVK